MRSLSLDGVFILARDAPLDEEMLVRLHQLWENSARTVRGDPLPEEAVRLHARMLLRHPEELSLVIVPPLMPFDGARGPAMSLTLSHLEGIALDERRENDVVIEKLTVEMPVLQAQRLTYATLWPGDLDVATPRGTARFLDACRRVREAMGAPFAFGASLAEMTEPDLVDPRARGWGVAYYGADLARALPLDALGGAIEVAREPDGGAWVTLDPLPFVDDAAKEARRREVERALDLPRRFGAEPQA